MGPEPCEWSPSSLPLLPASADRAFSLRPPPRHVVDQGERTVNALAKVQDVHDPEPGEEGAAAEEHLPGQRIVPHGRPGLSGVF